MGAFLDCSFCRIRLLLGCVCRLPVSFLLALLCFLIYVVYCLSLLIFFSFVTVWQVAYFDQLKGAVQAAWVYSVFTQCLTSILCPELLQFSLTDCEETQIHREVAELSPAPTTATCKLVATLQFGVKQLQQCFPFSFTASISFIMFSISVQISQSCRFYFKLGGILGNVCDSAAMTGFCPIFTGCYV